MLHTQLLRMINSRETWAFVGSGPSIEAGCPSWDDLRLSIVDGMSAEESEALDANRFYGDSVGKKDLPAAFGAIEDLIGRDRLEREAAAAIQRGGLPGPVHQLLADLPFAGYITTNYDHLLERALNSVDPGWSAVGNVGSEVLKASGTADRVVWHVHGSAELDSSKSRMVLTQEDYDSIYLDGSDVHTQLRGLMAHRRILVVGFGFRDVDVMQVLKRVGRLTDPGRPIVALVERAGDFRHQNGRDVFLTRFKVDVQPYRNSDGTHRNLRNVLSVYSSMSVRRSLRFGKHLRRPPSHDPETAGLLIYNDFVLANHGPEISNDIKHAVIRSRILVSCLDAPATRRGLLESLRGVADALLARVSDPAADIQTEQVLDEAIAGLIDSGLLLDDSGSLTLTKAGLLQVRQHAARAELSSEQFQVSLASRVSLATSVSRVDNVTQVVYGFFKQAIERRALGVALAFATGGLPSQQEYHTLALLQDLGGWLDSAEDEAAALAVVETVENVLRSPTNAEREFIGRGIQARFVLHMLSLDTDSLNVRRRQLAQSIFILDASTVIPWLATGSTGHLGAKNAVERLARSGSLIGTTSALNEEVAEHIRWAQSVITNAGGLQSSQVLAAATGRAGNKTNAFLEGFIRQHESAGGYGSFNSYVSGCLGVSSISDQVTNAQVVDALSRKDVRLLDILRIGEATDALRASSVGLATRIRAERQSNGTFKHERQVRAEADVVALIDYVRSGGLQIDTRRVEDAVFVSYTSLLNRVSQSQRPVTVRPEAIISWLATIAPADKEDVEAITSELLWELQERRMDLVDPEMLSRVFGPLVSASRDRLDEALPRYQALMSQRYGGDSTIDVAAIPELEVPVVLDNLLYDQAVRLSEELEARDRDLSAAMTAAAIAEEDRAELERARKKARRRNKYQKRMERRQERQ